MIKVFAFVLRLLISIFTSFFIVSFFSYGRVSTGTSSSFGPEASTLLSVITLIEVFAILGIITMVTFKWIRFGFEKK